MRRVERKKKSNPVKSPKTEPFFKKVQTKVSIGQPNDHYEKEADAMADAVTKGGRTNTTIKQKTSQQSETQSKPLASQITPLVQRAPEEETQAKVQRMEEEEAQTKVQRQEEEEAAQTKVQRMEEEETQTKVQRMEEEEAQTKVQRQEEEEAAQPKVQLMEEEEAQTKVQRMEEEEAQTKVQRMEEEEAQAKVQRMEEEEAQTKAQPKASKQSSVKPTMEATLKSKKGRGAKMDSKTKSEMETGFGADFSGVNIHTDSKSQEMSQEIGAQAFTHGNDVYFNHGKYNPQSAEGKHLLAHELTHTIQQKGVNKLQRQDKPPTTTPPTTTPGTTTTPAKTTTTATPVAKKSTLYADSLAKLKTFSAICHSYFSKATINGGLATVKKETYSGVDVLFKLNLKTTTGGGSVLALFTPGTATQNATAKPPNVTVDMAIDLDASVLTAASTPALVEKFARDMYHESIHMVIFIDSQRSDLTGSTALDSAETTAFKTYKTAALGLPEYAITKTEFESYIKSKKPTWKSTDITYFAVRIMSEIMEERFAIGKADKAIGKVSGTNNDIALTYLHQYLTRMTVSHTLTDKDFTKLYRSIGSVLTKADAAIAPKKKSTP